MSDHRIVSSNPAARGEPQRFPMGVGKPARRMILGAGILVVSLGFALVAASQSRPDQIAARLGISSLVNGTKASIDPTMPSEIKTPVGMVNVTDLQRRGNSLVGEVKTRDGAAMRLVFDARTHALIGMRVLDPVEQPAHEAEAALACPDQSSIAPLPLTTSALP